MNKAAFFGLLLCTFGIQIGLQLYLSKRSKEVTQQQMPLKLEVNFTEKRELSDEFVQVATPFALLEFSNSGAVLSEYTSFRTLNGVQQDFKVLARDQMLPRDQQACMVALDEQTPYVYRLESQTENENAHTITYVTDGISKQYVVHKDRPQIDLVLTVKPEKPTAVRLMWPSPSLKGLSEDEVLNGIMVTDKHNFKRLPEKKISSESYAAPRLFGTEDKYFVFACVKNTHAFAQRAYYKTSNSQLIALLESAPIETETTWTISFYFGPKDAALMNTVDKDLTKVFDYGLFSFITKPLLLLLKYVDNIVHNYGISILLVTLLLKLLLLPFTWSGPRKMKRIEEFQRKMDYLNQKYKHDKKALEEARSQLLQKEGLPVAGCLPLLLQLPFLIALQSGLSNSLELYRAPFILWIKDLSVADPYYVLPALVVLFFLMGGFMSQKAKGARQNITSFLIGLVMFAFTANLSAGLCLCILANIALHTLQTELQKKFGDNPTGMSFGV